MRTVLRIPLIKGKFGDTGWKKYEISPRGSGFGFYEVKFSLSVDPEFHKGKNIDSVVRYYVKGYYEYYGTWLDIFDTGTQSINVKDIPVRGEGTLDVRHVFKTFKPAWWLDLVCFDFDTKWKGTPGGYLYIENFTVTYYAFARIKGRVVDAKTLQPIAGATVKLKSELDYEFETKTNEEGKFAIGELYSLPLSVTYIPEGKYKITVSKAEYAKKEFEIKANPGENSIGDIKLMPIPTPPPPSPPPPPGIPEKVNWSLLALMALGAYLMLRGLQRRR